MNTTPKSLSLTTGRSWRRRKNAEKSVVTLKKNFVKYGLIYDDEKSVADQQKELKRTRNAKNKLDKLRKKFVDHGYGCDFDAEKSYADNNKELKAKIAERERKVNMAKEDVAKNAKEDAAAKEAEAIKEAKAAEAADAIKKAEAAEKEQEDSMSIITSMSVSSDDESDEEEGISIEDFEHDGKLYLRGDEGEYENNIYDYDTQELIGVFELGNITFKDKA